MGSLFKARDLWTLRLDAEEEFDAHAMALANFDNDPSGNEKIIIGSYQGVLRILNPKQKGYKPDDLLLEMTLGAPILQLAVGAFMANSHRHHLAILLPKKLLLATIIKQGQTQEGDVLGSQCGLRIEFEHHMEHTAYNFTCGPFGNTGTSRAQDLIAVQSMDGQISFFDHNKCLFTRFLPSSHFLVPGVFMYIKMTDSFVTGSSNLTLDCYRYSTFTQSTGSETKEAGQGRKVSVDWSFNLGEDVMDVKQCRLTRNLPNHQVDIVVLCERTLYVLKENGELRFNKRLDASAACLCPYTLPDSRTENVIVGTHNNDALMVYTDRTLAWSAKLPSAPLCVRVATVCGVAGMTVVLSENGVSANYLGTDPANNPVQVLDSKEIDYDAMDEEHRRLQAIMRQAVTQGKSEPRDLLHLSYDPPGVTSGAHGPVCQAILHVRFDGAEDLQNVVLTVHTSEPIEPEQHTYTIALLPQKEYVSVPLNFSVGAAGDRLAPTSLLAEVVACYTLHSGESLTAKLQFLLPMPLVASPVPPLKSTNFKVQIDTNKAPVDVRQLFEDFSRSGEVQANIVSLQYCNGVDATLLVSKNAGRYRVQSSTFEALWLITSEIVRRLKAHFRGDPEELRIEYSDAIPLEDYFTTIDNHFRARQDLVAAQQALAGMAQQFRAIQKRLLVRFRDKNPSSLASLENLFEDTYRKLHVHADAVEAQQAQLQHHSNVLVCGTHLMLLLTRYRFQETFSKEDFDVFRHFLTPVVINSSGGSGWEEMVDAGLTHLLRTVLSKNAKESSSVPVPLAVPADTTKLKKHMTLVFDRISKGFTLREKAKTDVEVLEKKKSGVARPAPQD